MKKLTKTIKLEAVEILGFGKKGNLIIGKKEGDVMVVDTQFAASHEPKVGDFMVREDGSDGPYRYMSAAEAATFK